MMGKRPDGLTYIPWRQGRCMVWDVTVVSSTAPSNLAASSRSSGGAATAAEERKVKKYDCLKTMYEVEPIGLETSGAFGHNAQKIVRKIGDKISAITGEKKSQEYLVQSLSIALQRGNARCIMMSLPATESMNNKLEEL